MTTELENAIKSRTTSNKPFIQVSKAAKILDCSKEFIHQLVRDGKLSAINLGQRMTRISCESLLEFVKNSKVDPEKYYE